MSDSTVDTSGDGRSGPYQSYWLVIVVFISIALYNVIELNFLVITTFKRFRGLYFWSFTCSTWGIAFNAVGYLLRHLNPDQSGYLHATLILIGWCSMVTGQSLVLYSRLHIVMHDPRLLRYVLGMIIVNAIWLSVPVIVLVYGTNSNNPELFRKPYSVFEKIQLTVFFVQEVLISSLYIVETTRLLKMQRGIASSSMRRVMGHLILVNVFVVLLDISILCLEFTEHYDIQTAWKALVYSVKLKSEFSVLNRLVEFSQHLRAGRNMTSVHYDTSTDVALERYLRNATQRPGGAEYSMQVTAERPGENSPPEGVEIVKTTAVTVSQNGRQLPATRPSTGANSSTGKSATEADEGQEADRASSSSSQAQLTPR
ncbi:hypothetical protein QQS21_001416 [Conoideocrella luteorostrata]|uniref:DUF7703 domain-containing protein n=1 Tax=Conoideocrella luteorostrata TaxID=1105319 RepID=A0AAJ0FY74_9HYPO|nr:hypothetical protein QQS21_001416 [Conoideocrella luteorostrata]